MSATPCASRTRSTLTYWHSPDRGQACERVASLSSVLREPEMNGGNRANLRGKDDYPFLGAHIPQ